MATRSRSRGRGRGQRTRWLPGRIGDLAPAAPASGSAIGATCRMQLI